MNTDKTGERIKAELEDIEIAVQDAQDAWEKYKNFDDRHYLMTGII